MVDAAIARHGARSAFDRVRSAAVAAGRPFDARSQLTVVRDWRRTVPSAVPFFNASDAAAALQRLRPEHSSLLPLSGKAHARTVNCNESGTWSWFDSDVHGFNNRDASWESPEVILLGDSFVMGQCVPPGRELASRLREQGLRVLSLGYAGNGPLTSFATFLEYAVPLRPSTVVWVFFDNDLTDLEGELARPQLSRYLTRGAVSLMSRSAERDSLVSRLLAAVVDSGVVLYPPPSMGQKVRAILTLYHLRGLVRGVFNADKVPLETRRALVQMLLRARDETAGWGGQLRIVRLPAWETFKYGRSASPVAAVVEEEAGRLAIPYFDAASATAKPEPWSAFAQGDLVPAHYSEAGYRRLAMAVATWLRQR